MTVLELLNEFRKAAEIVVHRVHFERRIADVDEPQIVHVLTTEVERVPESKTAQSFDIGIEHETCDKVFRVTVDRIK